MSVVFALGETDVRVLWLFGEDGEHFERFV
jgi:hypothetical protein